MTNYSRDALGRLVTKPNPDQPNDINLDLERVERAKDMTLIRTTPDGRTWGHFGGFDRQGEVFYFDVDGLPYVNDEHGYYDQQFRTLLPHRFFDIKGRQSKYFNAAVGRDVDWLEERQGAEEAAIRQHAEWVAANARREDSEIACKRIGLGTGLVLGGAVAMIGIVSSFDPHRDGRFVAAFVFAGLVILAACSAFGSFLSILDDEPHDGPSLWQVFGTAYLAYKVADHIDYKHQQRQAELTATALARKLRH